jgi:hypothetical protein
MTIQVSAQRNGFQATRNYSNDACRTYPVTLSTDQPLGINAAVAMANGTVVPVTAGQNPALAGLGVVVGLLDSNKKPLTFSQPTRGPYLTSAQTGFAIVLTDPNMTYRVRYEGSAGNDMVGNLVQVSGANGVTVKTGITTQTIKANVSADNSALFRVVGLYEDPLTGTKGTERYVEVQFNRHINRIGPNGDQ